jgi:ion channel-forming bestrophin family protein
MINYDPHDWRSHLCDIQGSMIREIIGRVLTCVLWAFLVVAIEEYFLVPRRLSLAIPETAHSLVGVALGLLLVFRTNASYDRFWEGRKQWGSIVNESRNLARGASVYLAAAPDLLRPLLLWTSAFTYATMDRLRGKRAQSAVALFRQKATDDPSPVPGTAELGATAARLPADEVHRVLAGNHLPLAVSRQISGLLATARDRGAISDYVMIALDQNVQLLIDYMGACERIRNTRIPYAYMVHLRRALIVYCFTLPFALIGRFGWMTGLAVMMVAYILYGIEEIGVEIEDPFGTDENDLPLEQFCETIEANLMGVAEEVEREGMSGAL